jgi:hypothetical protein
VEDTKTCHSRSFRVWHVYERYQPTPPFSRLNHLHLLFIIVLFLSLPLHLHLSPQQPVTLLPRMEPLLSTFLLTIILGTNSNFASASTAPTPGYPSFHTTYTWSNTTTQGSAFPTLLPDATPSSGFTTVHSKHIWKSETHHHHSNSAGYGMSGFEWPGHGTGGVAASTGYVPNQGSSSETVSPCRSPTITVTLASRITSTNVTPSVSFGGHSSVLLGSSAISDSPTHSWSQEVPGSPTSVLPSTAMPDVTPSSIVSSQYSKEHLTLSRNCTLTGTTPLSLQHCTN